MRDIFKWLAASTYRAFCCQVFTTGNGCPNSDEILCPCLGTGSFQGNARDRVNELVGSKLVAVKRVNTTKKVIFLPYPSIVIHKSGDISSSEEQSHTGSATLGAKGLAVNYPRNSSFDFCFNYHPVPRLVHHLRRMKQISLATMMLQR